METKKKKDYYQGTKGQRGKDGAEFRESGQDSAINRHWRAFNAAAQPIGCQILSLKARSQSMKIIETSRGYRRGEYARVVIINNRPPTFMRDPHGYNTIPTASMSRPSD